MLFARHGNSDDDGVGWHPTCTTGSMTSATSVEGKAMSLATVADKGVPCWVSMSAVSSRSPAKHVGEDASAGEVGMASPTSPKCGAAASQRLAGEIADEGFAVPRKSEAAALKGDGNECCGEEVGIGAQSDSSGSDASGRGGSNSLLHILPNGPLDSQYVSPLELSVTAVARAEGFGLGRSAAACVSQATNLLFASVSCETPACRA
mmetsp:Transcript_144066/g.359187  ORF Transcript_144066/g.359187 Transcript_144066/m.359187 type:complete len:206 (-) Transcript_144066:406-1023(-)